MKKFLIGLILIVLVLTLVACGEPTFEEKWSSDTSQHWHASTSHEGEKADVGNHSWKTSGLDANGNTQYVCSVCGYSHQHIYDATAWEFNGREHWHPASCSHSDAPLYKEEHDVDVDTGICTVCNCDMTITSGYEVAFAYYVVDENGNPVADANGVYTQIGVTYTSVIKDGSMPIDTVNGGVLYKGDKVSFTVEKSVFCYYTDRAESPLVEVIFEDADGNRGVETIYPDEDGVYTVEIESDTVISVANVLTSPSTVSGKGTQEDPFTINSVVDWLYFAAYINESNLIDYNIAYWKLTTDLDFEGESIYVIGDGFTSGNAVFCGNFDGGGHTLSNFVLDNALATTVGEGYSNYIGLFGVVTGYVGVESVIANLTIDNATINATAADDDIVSAGVLVGYGVGTNISNCVVKNSTINVNADDIYMSFAGGMVGYLQSGVTEEGIAFYASVGYSSVENLDINGTGMLYSAGGIAGRVMSYDERVTAFVYNCHTDGDIADAVRAGGIVGDLQRYGSIQNCYSVANVEAYTTFSSDVDESMAATMYDDRYSYAGGIVGYVENDTVVSGCFFDGDVYATAILGAKYAKASNIVAGYSASKEADFNSQQVVLNNQADGVQVTEDLLKNQFKWNEADWVFGDGYPTINQEEASLTFTVTINIDGVDEYDFDINSQYRPLSFWYILSGETISRYYQDGAKRTYGYYFDDNCTQPVPAGFVPMTDVTLYAKYADTATIAGEYFVSSAGVSAVVTIATDGTYTYEQGAILLEGEYKFDGETITFANAVFARLAPTATDAQKASYYTFWAKVEDNGNLSLYDCEEIYSVTAEQDEQNPTFTAMARFFPIGKPLTILNAINLSFTGGYYYIDGNVKHVFEFGNDFAGVYKRYIANEVVYDSKFQVQVGSGTLLVELEKNGTEYTIAVEGDNFVSITETDGTPFTIYQIDDFAGTWEKKATSHKIYTFDGMGNWSYEHYVYLNEDEVVNAQKHTVTKDSGTYTFDVDGNLIFTRDGISVVATIENGVVFVTENGQPVEVQFNNLGSFTGVWYTAANKIVRYTLTLDGLKPNGIGLARLDGFNTAPLELRYTAVNENTLYLYIDDIVYAVLSYDAKLGVFDGLFYDNATASTTTPQTLYLYDDFKGVWVSNITGLENVKFNGFGDYNYTDETGNSLAVRGIVTIGNSSLNYTLDRATGNACFTYNSVEYTLSYNEYTDTIAVSYGGNNGVIAKADVYYGMTLVGGGYSYSFDGRGNFINGNGTFVGAVIRNGDTSVEGRYHVENGNIVMKFGGEADQTIVVSDTGYTLGGSTLFVDNAFSGTWAVSNKSISIVVGNIAYIPANGQTIAIAGTFNGESVTMYYDGIDTLSFEVGASKYSLIKTLDGKVPAMIFTETRAIGEEVVTEMIAVKQDDMFGVWTSTSNENRQLTFDGTGASPYVSSGSVEYQERKGRVFLYSYKIVNGVVTIYKADGTVFATFEECAKDDGDNYIDTSNAYKNGDRYYQLLLA